LEPILLVHGYSTDAGSEPNRDSVVKMYGDLPKWLRSQYKDDEVYELDVSRYISLEDGISIDDIARAFDTALRTDFSHLYNRTFHVIIHSTGALVMRTWLRKHSGNRQPIRNLIYLAGANFGSGWASLGRGQLSRWYRKLSAGDEPGVKVLNALELGSSDTIDTHLALIEDGDPIDTYGVREYVITGSQAQTESFLMPIRFAKEDGADGVIRVAAASLNFNYVKYVANNKGLQVTASDVAHDLRYERLPASADYYHVDQEASSIAGVDRKVVPLAIPWGTAHIGAKAGVVDGSANRDIIEPLLTQALGTRTATQWRGSVGDFQDVTDDAYDKAATHKISGFWEGRWSRKAQYEAHSQIILRLRDQDGAPVEHYDIHFDRGPDATKPGNISNLIQHTHRNDVTPNVFTFYLRTGKWDKEKKTFRDDQGAYLSRLNEIDQALLEITATEPQTDDIRYVPFRKTLNTESLVGYIHPHATTVVDIEMLRIPSGNVFAMFKH